MSKVLGVIAEYNPFHNGHLYHLKESKRITGADYTIAIISGNFTQRGSTSIVDKWSKTKMALDNGIDLVIELPVLYAISSAENFADGAIKILNSLGVVDYLSFGSECANISILSNIADILCDEPDLYRTLLSSELDNGISFPKARENALLEYLNINNILNDFNMEDYKKALSSSNNILGIEYLKALKKYKSSIKPVCVKRSGSDYNSVDIPMSSNLPSLASATAIRELIKSKEYDRIKELVPISTYSILLDCLNNGCIVPDLYSFEKEIIYVLRKMSVKEIANLPDVSEGLEFLIKKAANSCNSIDELLSAIKSKRYTVTRLQRILLYALLDISNGDMDISKMLKSTYVRVLGFNENGKNLVSEIMAQHPDMPLVTSVKKFSDNILDSSFKLLLNKDIFATDVYSIAFDGNSFANLDFKNGIIKKKD